MSIPTRLSFFAAVAIALLATGCATTTPSSSDLFTKARFRTMTASQPKQQALLKTLPAGKITQVTHRRHTYYVFPDPELNRIFVGTSLEYTAYQKICARRKIAPAPLVAAAPPTGTIWEDWSGMGYGWYTFPF
ncbi:MAG: hypothetical protein ACREKL_12700 [Chthoniobacterales bacterium]